MACYQKNHLKDSSSERFLESRGFKSSETCSQKSYWFSDGGCYLYLDINEVINSDADIHAKIARQYEIIGRETGKQDALNIINQNLINLVFPQKSKNDIIY